MIKKINCPECDGSGFKLGTEDEPCEDCKGTGYLEAEEIK